MALTWTTFSAPSRFEPLVARVIPWLWAVAIGFALAGLYVGFIVAPTDFQQGQSYRIIFIHVPAAWMSMVLYDATVMSNMAVSMVAAILGAAVMLIDEPWWPSWAWSTCPSSISR